MLSQPCTISIPATTPQPKLRTYYIREWLCFLVGLAITFQLIFGYRYYTIDLPQSTNDKHAANSTLGFGAIYAVSRGGSNRQQSLLAAADLTSLNITIPTQPIWTEIDLIRVRAFENSTLDRGSALAWLGHRHALKQFLKSPQHTALIMEDDVDWDTRIRTQQIPRVAHAVRELSGSGGSHYYGNLRLWDVLWLGHCGDYFTASRGSTIAAIKSFKDPAMPNLRDLHPWTQNFMNEIGAHGDQQRLVHPSVNPLCTFAYAVTRTGAERLANDLAIREPSRDQNHPCKAYDVRLLEGCRDEGLRCVSINPELFHHSNIHSEIAHVTANSKSEGASYQGEASTEISTTNIRCSARSRKWQDLRDELMDLSVDADAMVRKSAESPQECYIDNM